jgi:hypothetical protein
MDGLRLDVWSSIPSGDKRYFYTPQYKDGFGTHPASGALSQGVNCPGHETGHSPVFGVLVKNGGSYTSSPYLFGTTYFDNGIRYMNAESKIQFGTYWTMWFSLSFGL